MKLSRQAKIVLDHLRNNPHMTSWQAEGVYRIRRLASRIDELRAAGYEIVKSTVNDATGQRYTRYSLSRRQARRERPILPPRTRAGRNVYTEAQVRKVLADLLMWDTEIEEIVNALNKEVM